MLREFAHYQAASELVPIQIDEFIYYRRVENQADNFNLYRFPVSELQKFGIDSGEIPTQLEKQDEPLEDEPTKE